MSGNTGIYDRMTAWELVEYYGRLYGMPEERLQPRLDELFTTLQMQDFRDMLGSKMSTGMKQKVSIARTIIHDPPVLIFDEPTSGLDVLVARALLKTIASLKDQGKCIIFSTHIMREVEKLCDRVAIIHKGRILAEGSVRRTSASATGSTDMEELFFDLISKHEQRTGGAGMLNWRNVTLIFHREVRDQLRDRRTLFMIAVLPLLLVPRPGTRHDAARLRRSASSREPSSSWAPNICRPSRRCSTATASRRPWFPAGADPARLVVITDLPGIRRRTPGPPMADVDRPPGCSSGRSEIRDAAATATASKVGGIVRHQRPAGADRRPRRLRRATWQPCAEQLVAPHDVRPTLPTDYPRPEIICNKADEKSLITFNRVADVLENWEAAILDDWLQTGPISTRNSCTPRSTEPVDVALDEQHRGQRLEQALSGAAGDHVGDRGVLPGDRPGGGGKGAGHDGDAADLSRRRAPKSCSASSSR